MLSLANVVGAILGPIVNKWFSVRKMLIYGEFIMAGFLCLIVTFTHFKKEYWNLASIVFFIIAY